MTEKTTRSILPGSPPEEIKAMTVRFPKSTFMALHLNALDQNISANTIVNQAVSSYLSQNASGVTSAAQATYTSANYAVSNAIQMMSAPTDPSSKPKKRGE